HYANHG
ncbi:hypothetical protein HG1_04510, partial [Bacillus anthracis]